MDRIANWTRWVKVAASVALVGFLTPGCDLLDLTPPPHKGVRFKTSCNFDHAAPDDPIVFPNQPGAAHLHDFTGAVGVNAATVTWAQLQASHTTCNDPADKAAYWTPAITVNGVKRDPLRTTAYYRRGSKEGAILPYPAGLKILAGHDLANPSAPTGETGWRCGTATEAETGQLRPTPVGCEVDLTMRIHFPDCWDGKTLDSANHRSHMAYAVPGGRNQPSVCPSSHPVPLPALTTYTHYGDLAASAVVALSSSPSAQHGVHGDFFNGWGVDRLNERVDACLDTLVKCPSGG